MHLNHHIITTRGHQWLEFWRKKLELWSLGAVSVDHPRYYREN